MRLATAENATRGRVLGTRIALADRWWLRLRGLLGRRTLPPGEGLLLEPCTSVHTLGMAFPIDVAFLDAAGRVLACYPDLAPARLSRLHRNARSALELPAGTLQATGTLPGDVIRFRADPRDPVRKSLRSA